jgi:hypothetical protein
VLLLLESADLILEHGMLRHTLIIMKEVFAEETN